MIAVSDLEFLLFDAEKSDGLTVKLIFWADLQSLVKIRRKRGNSERVELQWKNYKDSTLVDQSFQI